jgi:hypothetical protein
MVATAKIFPSFVSLLIVSKISRVWTPSEELANGHQICKGLVVTPDLSEVR